MQPVWDEYVGDRRDRARRRSRSGRRRRRRPYPHARTRSSTRSSRCRSCSPSPPTCDRIALMDGDLDRPAMTGGASVYPFCWSLLLAARAAAWAASSRRSCRGAEPDAAPLLGLPDDHALAATIFLGHPTQQPTRLTRQPGRVVRHDRPLRRPGVRRRRCLRSGTHALPLWARPSPGRSRSRSPRTHAPRTIEAPPAGTPERQPVRGATSTMNRSIAARRPARPPGATGSSRMWSTPIAAQRPIVSTICSSEPPIDLAAGIEPAGSR